jgi:TRAP-type C4-dicarboxylate transport system permease small subunit
MAGMPSGREGAAPADTLTETAVERACRVACEVVLVAMVVSISAEVVARMAHFSFEIVDEVGGYLLSALTFLSLPVALIGGAYHQVEYVRQRLGRRGRAASGIVFTLLSLAFAAVLAWQLWRLVWRSFAAGVTAPTVLGTPLWIPQSAMLIGVAALIYALVRMLLAHGRALRAAGAQRRQPS